MERMALSMWRVPGCWGMKEEEEDGVTGGTWEAGTLSVGLAMRLLGTAHGSTYTMHVHVYTCTYVLVSLSLAVWE